LRPVVADGDAQRLLLPDQTAGVDLSEYRLARPSRKKSVIQEIKCNRVRISPPQAHKRAPKSRENNLLLLTDSQPNRQALN